MSPPQPAPSPSSAVTATGAAPGAAGASAPTRYPRDLAGYGRNPPHPKWPGGARVALQFVLNYEEGGENSVLHGDAGSEQFLSEMFNPASYPSRHLSMEGIYEYGSRVGVWRLLREFRRRRLPLTIFGVGMALERSPEVTAAFIEDGHEIASHGWRWIHYQNLDEDIEREHLVRSVETIERLTGERPLGWYTGRDSPNTRRLVADYGGFEYDSDYYGDELPFWLQVRRSDGTLVTLEGGGVLVVVILLVAPRGLTTTKRRAWAATAATVPSAPAATTPPSRSDARAVPSVIGDAVGSSAAITHKLPSPASRTPSRSPPWAACARSASEVATPSRIPAASTGATELTERSVKVTASRCWATSNSDDAERSEPSKVRDW